MPERTETVEFFVRNKRTKQVLNEMGGWSEHHKSYKTCRYATEELAVAAFPEGVDCEAVSIKRKD